MARPLRLEYEGALYHLTTRGSERSAIFRGDRDRERFLEILGGIAGEERWALHGYCLMGNHYHLLLETPRGNLSAGMRNLNGRFTQWFNLRHRRTGHLLEGRFKGILIEKEAHLLELARYIVLNPVRARMTKHPGEWPWSNYRATAGLVTPPSWLEVDWTLGQFAKGRETARDAYRKFVAQGKGLPDPFEEVERQIFLGSPSFVAAMGRRLGKKRDDEDIPLSQRRPGWVGFDRIRRAVAAEFGVEPERLGRRRGRDDKMAGVFLARKLSGLKVREIAAAFGVKPARVSNIVREVESGSRPELVKRIEKLRARLEPEA